MLEHVRPTSPAARRRRLAGAGAVVVLAGLGAGVTVPAAPLLLACAPHGWDRPLPG